jgi:thymidine phosphorylase
MVLGIDAEALGNAAMGLGAGRAKVDDRIDPAVGLVIERRIGDRVVPGDALAVVHAGDQARADEAIRRVQAAYRIGSGAPLRRPLVWGVVT